MLALVRPAWQGASEAMPMDVLLVLWFSVCTARTGKQGWALGGIWGKVVVMVVGFSGCCNLGLLWLGGAEPSTDPLVKGSSVLGSLIFQHSSG